MLDFALTVVAENPDASDDEIGRRLHSRLQDMRLLVVKNAKRTSLRDRE